MTGRIKLRYILRPREVSDRADLTVLSVYRDHGVIPKDSRSDNFNRTPLDLSRYQEVRVRELVVNKMKAWQGSLAVSKHHGIVSPDYLVCSINPSVDARYLHYLLRSALMVEQYVIRSKGIRPAQWRLYWEDLADIDVRIPSTDEQRRIADFLDSETRRIDAVIAARRAQAELIQERRFALVREVLAQGLRGEKQQQTTLTWLPHCPKSWALTPLRYLVRCLDGRRVPLSVEQRALRPGQYPYYGASSIVDRIDGYLFDEPLVLLGEDGAQLGNPGYEIAFYVQGRIWVNNHAHVLRPERIDGRYLAHVLNVFDRETCMSGATREKITQDAMNGIIVPVPSPDEQLELVAHLDEQLKDARTLDHLRKTQMELLIERRQALITAAVTGQIDVTTARGADVS